VSESTRTKPAPAPAAQKLPGPKAAAIVARLRAAEGAGMRTGAADAPLVIETASGSTIVDPDGNRFTDLHASFAAATIGHAHPDVTSAIVRQASRFTHAPSAFASEVRIGFEEDLLAMMPPELDRVLLGLSGSDANDLAIKLARTLTGRREVIAFAGGYLGRGSGVVGFNGKVAFRERVGVGPDAHFFPYPYPYRWRLGPPDFAGEGALTLLDDALGSGASGIGQVAAIVVEPVQGNGGVVIPPDGFLAGLRQLADRHGIVLIFDEIQSGFGRTGRLWASEHWQVTPDLMTVGKGIGGGMAVSAVVGRQTAMGHWQPGSHSSTFLTNGLNLAAGRAALEVMRRERLWERSASLGTATLERLQARLGTLDAVGEVRGLGLFLGIEVVTDRSSRAPDAAAARRIVARCLDEGVIVGLSGHFDNVVKISPPLTIPEDALWPALDIVVAVIEREVGQT
jgi:4-aminobutyrate aminotransferase-like enzyme